MGEGEPARGVGSQSQSGEERESGEVRKGLLQRCRRGDKGSKTGAEHDTEAAWR